MYGFKYSESLTKKSREKAAVEDAQHLRHTLLVFINPLVASRPEHAHLLAEPGCFKERGHINVQCGEEKKEVHRIQFITGFSLLSIFNFTHLDFCLFVLFGKNRLTEECRIHSLKVSSQFRSKKTNRNYGRLL